MEATGFTAATGQADFLELFVAQLQNQDPLEPVGQQEFLGQLAQFSTVEGLEKLNAKQTDFNTQLADLLQLQLLNSGTDLLGKSNIQAEVLIGNFLEKHIVKLDSPWQDRRSRLDRD